MEVLGMLFLGKITLLGKVREGFSYIQHVLLLIVRIFSKTKLDIFLFIYTSMIVGLRKT